MKGRKSFALESISFGFRALIENVRLFFLAMLTSSGIIAVVIGIIALVNLRFIQKFLTQIFQDYQECVGYNCVSAVYESGRSLLGVSAPILSLIVSILVFAIIFIGLDLGFKRIALDLHDRDNSSLNDLFSCFNLVPKALGAWILYCIIVGLGLICFVIPGFIAMLRFAFFPYFIVDKKAGPIDALKMSYEKTENQGWDVFALWVALKMITYISFLSWIGGIVMWPLSTLAYAFFYRRLVAEKGHRLDNTIE